MSPLSFGFIIWGHMKKQSEFYGKEFALFDDGDGQPKNLKAVLKARPDRREKRRGDIQRP